MKHTGATGAPIHEVINMRKGKCKCGNTLDKSTIPIHCHKCHKEYYEEHGKLKCLD